MYQNVFAFGLGELQTPTSLEGADVTGQIYSAGLGAAITCVTSIKLKINPVKSGRSVSGIVFRHRCWRAY